MNVFGLERKRQIATVVIGALLAIVMGGVLIMGFRLATQITANVTALQTASGLQSYPALLSQHLNSLRDRLEARAYAGQALADLRATVEAFDRDLKELSSKEFSGSEELEQAQEVWRQYGPVINPVVSFTEQPYVDSDESGSALSRAGRIHYADVKRAQLFAREKSDSLQNMLTSLASFLQQEISSQANRLRLLLSTGVLAALALAGAAAWFQLTRAKHMRAAQEAQEQTRDILKTVKEGFFLLDAEKTDKK
jgi:hypothetical protein